MFKTILKISVTIFLVFLFVAPDAFSVTRGTAKKQKEKRERNRNKSVWVMPEIKLLLFPRLTAGKLTGDAGDAVSSLDESATDKIYYGGGLGLEYWYKPSIIFGVGFDLLQKDLGHLKIDDPIRARLITAEVAYRYPGEGKISLILRARGGQGSLSYAGEHIHNYFFKRFGLGIYSFEGSSSICVTLEFYYQSANTKGSQVSVSGYNFEVPGTLTMIGFEIGLGIPIMKN